jgi:hypothetical protein
MSHKLPIFIELTGIVIIGTVVILWAMTPLTALAQCGSNPPPKSSCITCHETEDPVYENGEWHDTHALKDCCTNCHGGNCSTMDKELAHEDLVVHPLEDIYTNCHKCHPDDYQTRAEGFGVILGVTPSSSPTSTPVPASLIVEHPIIILPSSTSSQAFTLPLIPIIFGFSFLALLVVGLTIMSRQLRKQG